MRAGAPSSPRSSANRKAERPVNALLNYCFALLEAEAVLACQAVGLDPGLGIVHADARGRVSMALDLMEPVRPEVEGFVLDMVEHRTFRKAEFTETSDGHVRLLAPLTHELAETMPTWARSLAPFAEKVAHTLGRAMDGKYAAGHAAHILTDQGGPGDREGPQGRGHETGYPGSSPPARRRPSRQHSHCGPVPTAEEPSRTLATSAASRASPADPTQAPEIRGRRGAAIAARKRVLSEWEKANLGTVHDPELFLREILPRLATVKLSEIVGATGMSKASASDVRCGKWTPHVSTWSALAALTGVVVESVAQGADTDSVRLAK